MAQIPLWWGFTSATPTCLFEDSASAGCEIQKHILSMKTPSGTAFGYCEAPFSTTNIRLSPIPGTYPIRILTFQNGGKWYPEGVNNWDIPLEQDTFIIDIPKLSIAA